MIRRPLWNRGGGVFVEEATWQPPVDEEAAAPGQPDAETPAVDGAAALSRAAHGGSTIAADEPVPLAAERPAPTPTPPAADQPSPAARRGAPGFRRRV